MSLPILQINYFLLSKKHARAGKNKKYFLNLFRLSILDNGGNDAHFCAQYRFILNRDNYQIEGEKQNFA